MSVSAAVHHDVLPNIIMWTFCDKWTWDDFFVCQQQVIQMASEFNGGRWDTISDHRQTPHVPVGAGVTHVWRAMKVALALNHGMTVVVSKGAMVMMLSKTLLRLYPEMAHHFAVVPTLEDAYALISADRTRVAVTHPTTGD